jgi:hypothetical protein
MVVGDDIGGFDLLQNNRGQVVQYIIASYAFA